MHSRGHGKCHHSANSVGREPPSIQVNPNFAEGKLRFAKAQAGQGVTTDPANFSHAADIAAAEETDHPGCAAGAVQLSFGRGGVADLAPLRVSPAPAAP